MKSTKKLTTNEFIEKAKQIHGDKYDYSKVEYKGSKEKVCIICPKHGEFWQTPNHHLKGSGCKECGNITKSNAQRYNLEVFIEKAYKLHGDKYDYSKVKYVNSSTKVCIICPIHGEFLITPNHFFNGVGCPKCSGNKKLTTNDFIKRAKEIHGEKYDYSKVDYINYHTKICIICPTHGEFWQMPSAHLQSQGCPICGGTGKLNTETFVKKANEIHREKYDYSKANYIDAHTKVCIICPTHGEFWQLPYVHLQGYGCSKCNSSHLENEIRDFLKNKNITIEEQKRFEWLGRQSLDFYLPKYNIAIECQGRQHFNSIGFFGGEKGLNDSIKRDIKKRQLCEEHGIEILYYSNLGIQYPYKVYENKEDLLKTIGNT